MVVSGVRGVVTILLPARDLSHNRSPMRIRGNTKCALTAARPSTLDAPHENLFVGSPPLPDFHSP
jgi:hypothetical protein